ncbi:TlpA family protein disulfide reductase [Oceanobacillus sojae]|uniref:TlpA family protein disulfide reductase n=1 Tax=Oceanobacillus sojae TaxID=582851 RepID=UPI0009886542|nr:thioredoxin fold domain-containing protein [Oceanobacillus sojae]MCT1904761.1 thioredoxin fold domain-containing protein [Oceanobacillus sojae]
MQIYDILPDLTQIKRLPGSNQSLLSSSGRPILVIFWSVNCSSCSNFLKQLAEVPEIKAKKVIPILIHIYLDKEQISLSAIKNKLDQLHFDAVSLDDTEDRLAAIFQFRYVPALYLFDKQERLRFKQSGKSSTNLMEQRLKRLLNEK